MSKRRKNQDIKVIIALLVILLVCALVIGFGFWKFFYSGAGSSKYGDRLEEIEKYPLDDNLETNIKSVYTGNDNIGKVDVTVEGRVIYLPIYMCYLLKSIELPEGVTIGKDAFVKTGVSEIPTV